MKMVRMLIQVPATLKAKLDAMLEGQHLLEQHFKRERQKPAA